MHEVFRDWRRKAGYVTLLMRSLAMSGLFWVLQVLEGWTENISLRHVFHSRPEIHISLPAALETAKTTGAG